MLQLRDFLHWCDCDGRAVFLDVRDDRYFCLSNDANAAFLRLAAGTVQPGDDQALGLLVARGLLKDAAAGTVLRCPPCVEPPMRDVPALARDRLGPFRAVRWLAAELGEGRALRMRPFHEVLGSVESCKPRRHRSSPQCDRPLGALVSAANKVAFLTRSHDRCLVRALAMYRICRTMGHSPKLVFGVIAHPFTAHCWVQLGSDVLVGGYEQARLYTPILVVE